MNVQEAVFYDYYDLQKLLEGLVETHGLQKSAKILLCLSQPPSEQDVKERQAYFIQKLVTHICDYFEISVEDFPHRKRRGIFMDAQVICVYLLHTHSGIQQVEIATLFKLTEKQVGDRYQKCKAYLSNPDYEKEFCQHFRHLEQQYLHMISSAF